MPTVTFLGPHYARRYPDGKGEFIRNSPITVTQAWLDLYRGHLPEAVFRLGDDEAPTFDEGADGIPDKSWRIKAIRSWLESYGMNPKGYATKGTLLKTVDDILNPVIAEEIIDEIEETVEAEEATPEQIEETEGE